MLKKPTPIASHPKFSGRIIDVSTERLLYNNGREYDLDFVRHPGAAAVVAIDDAQRVCLVRQYRHGIADFLWEIPAGKLDKGEPPQTCAIRELSEETGVSAKRWTALGRFLPAPAYSLKSSTSISRASSPSGRPRRTPMKNWNCNGCLCKTPLPRC